MRTTFFLMLAGFFAWLFHARYWLWRSCIDQAASSCVTPDGMNLTSGGLIWGVLAVVFLGLALVSLLASRRCGQ